MWLSPSSSWIAYKENAGAIGCTIEYTVEIMEQELPGQESLQQNRQQQVGVHLY